MQTGIECEGKNCKTEQPDARLYNHPTKKDFIGQPVNRFFCETCALAQPVQWNRVR